VDDPKYEISATIKELTILQSKVMKEVHLTAFRTPEMGLIGMMIRKIQLRAKTTWRQKMNLIQRKRIALRVGKAQSSGM
jgi:hypothetical protein